MVSERDPLFCRKTLFFGRLVASESKCRGVTSTGVAGKGVERDAMNEQSAVTPGVSPSANPLPVTPGLSQEPVTLPLCACGCGRRVPGPKFTSATTACRKRVQRQLEKAAKEQSISRNELNSENPTAPKSSFREKISSAAKTVAEKFGFQPKVLPSPVGEGENIFGATLPPVDSASGGILFRKAAVACFKFCFTIASSIVGSQAKKTGYNDDELKALKKSLEPDPDALKDTVESLDAVLKKHRIQPKNAEEWALAMNLCRLFSPHATAFMQLRKDHAAREEKSDELSELRAEVDRLKSERKAA